MCLIVSVSGSYPFQNYVPSAPLPDARISLLARTGATSATTTTVVRMVVPWSRAHEAGRVASSRLNQSLPRDLSGRSRGGTRRGLRRRGPRQPHQLGGGVEFLILRTHPFDL